MHGLSVSLAGLRLGSAESLAAVSRISGTRGAAIGAVLIALIALVWWLPIGSWSAMLAERLRGMGATGVVLFIVIYVIAEVALLPGAPFTLAPPSHRVQ